MRKLKYFRDARSIFALFAFLIVTVISLISVFSPYSISDLTKNMINYDAKYIEPIGNTIRPAVVMAQMNVFILVMLMIIIFAGVAIGGVYISIKSQEASSVAVGGGKKAFLLWIFGIIFIIVFCLLGIGLPNAIFNPTDLNTLAIYSPVINFAVKYRLGGILVIGGIGSIFSLITAGIYFIFFVVLPRSRRESKMKNTLRLH